MINTEINNTFTFDAFSQSFTLSTNMPPSIISKNIKKLLHLAQICLPLYLLSNKTPNPIEEIIFLYVMPLNNSCEEYLYPIYTSSQPPENPSPSFDPTLPKKLQQNFNLFSLLIPNLSLNHLQNYLTRILFIYTFNEPDLNIKYQIYPSTHLILSYLQNNQSPPPQYQIIKKAYQYTYKLYINLKHATSALILLHPKINHLILSNSLHKLLNYPILALLYPFAIYFTLSTISDIISKPYTLKRSLQNIPFILNLNNPSKPTPLPQTLHHALLITTLHYLNLIPTPPNLPQIHNYLKSLPPLIPHYILSHLAKLKSLNQLTFCLQNLNPQPLLSLLKSLNINLQIFNKKSYYLINSILHPNHLS